MGGVVRPPPPGKPTLTSVTSGQNAPTDTSLNLEIYVRVAGQGAGDGLRRPRGQQYGFDGQIHLELQPCPVDVPAGLRQRHRDDAGGSRAGRPRRRTTSRRGRGTGSASKSAWSDAVTATTTAISMQMQTFSGGSSDSDQDPPSRKPPLTASFEQVPAEHNGKRKFSFLVRLSETVGQLQQVAARVVVRGDAGAGCSASSRSRAGCGASR